MKRPLFTFVIPAYNGSPYIEDSIHSLINDRILENNIHIFYEIIIINDGSIDNTVAKANGLAEKWNQKTRENFIRVIDKENGQYGSVINRGIKEAKGIYFKVLDVDDTFHTSSLISLIKITNGFKNQVDLILTDHVYEKVAVNKREKQSLINSFVPYEILNIKDQNLPKVLITMHSIIYRLDLLKKIGFKQIEGVYYSDSQYSLIPLEFVNTMYYMDIPLYRYYIGRTEQSINLKVMVKNRLHQLKVVEAIWDGINFNLLDSKKIEKYMISVMKQMAQWQLMLIAFDSSVSNKPQYLMWFIEELKKFQPKKYRKITNNSLFWALRITKGHGMGFIIRVGIRIYSKFKKNIMAEWD